MITINVFENERHNEKLMTVINNVVEEFERLIPAGPPLGFKPIELINDHISGPTFYWPLEGNSYKIALNISDLNYNQCAFQFSQELCRIYCDPAMKGWFIQLLSHVFALYTLEFLSLKWKDNPPNQELKDYWYNFDSYKSNLLATAFSKVDLVQYQVANEWVQYQVNKLMSKSKINKGKLIIIAYELLPMFKTHPESWQIMPYVAKSSISLSRGESAKRVIDSDTEPDFEKLLNEIPEHLNVFVGLFYKKLGVL